jgi:CRISPR/Cas system-associated protein Cas10 (large subunit of type III CRISPR-Cas system)
MSETVHYKGKLIPTGKTLKEFDPNAHDISDHCEKAVDIDGLVYEVQKEYIDPYSDIFKSSKNDDGTIDFEIKYYNGACCFYEAIDYALKTRR